MNSNPWAASAHVAAREKWRKTAAGGAEAWAGVSAMKRGMFQMWCFFISRQSVVRLTCSSRAVAETSP
jgi:hypothetical protein